MQTNIHGSNPHLQDASIICIRLVAVLITMHHLTQGWEEVLYMWGAAASAAASLGSVEE